MSNKNASAYYSQPSRQGGSPRETEGRALMEAARRLNMAQQNPEDRDTMLENVRLNWRLWTIFQSEASSPESPLPAPIKENVIKLCNFVDKQTVDILADPEPGKLDILISINKNIAVGLLANPAQQAPDASAPASGAVPTLERLSA